MVEICDICGRRYTGGQNAEMLRHRAGHFGRGATTLSKAMEDRLDEVAEARRIEQEYAWSLESPEHRVLYLEGRVRQLEDSIARRRARVFGRYSLRKVDEDDPEVQRLASDAARLTSVRDELRRLNRRRNVDDRTPGITRGG